jgi:hypothetical protein
MKSRLPQDIEKWLEGRASLKGNWPCADKGVFKKFGDRRFGNGDFFRWLIEE